MKDVLDEAIAIFPSPYIHIGGDEAVKTQWRASEEIQRMIRDKGLKGEEELQTAFTREICEHLAARGRRLVGWDEILEGGLAAGAIAMSWRGEAGGIAAARAGQEAIMAPTSDTYFDYYQGPPESEPRAIGGRIPLEKVYAYEPVPAASSAEEARRIPGAQAQLWGEFISDRAHREYMTYPPACAFAEVVGSPREGRSLESFLSRLAVHLERLKAAGIRFRPRQKDPIPWEGRADPNAPAAARSLAARILGDRADLFRFDPTRAGFREAPGAGVRRRGPLLQPDRLRFALRDGVAGRGGRSPRVGRGVRTPSLRPAPHGREARVADFPGDGLRRAPRIPLGDRSPADAPADRRVPTTTRGSGRRGRGSCRPPTSSARSTPTASIS